MDESSFCCLVTAVLPHPHQLLPSTFPVVFLKYIPSCLHCLALDAQEMLVKEKTP